MKPVERNVAIRDGSISFRVIAGGEGQPLIYFQSIFDREPWSPFVESLAESFHVHLPLLPGAQGSIGIEAIDDIFDLTLAHDELLNELGLEQVHLVGHSLGGLLAAELASVFPSRCQRMALLAPYGLWRDEMPSPDVLILPPDDLLEVLWKDQKSKAAQEWGDVPAEEAERLSLQLDEIQRRAAASKFIWPLPDAGTKKRLHRVSAPTLLLWGNDDRANPAGYASLWKELLPSAEICSVAGGHMMLHEAPSGTADLVRRFFVERPNND